jgi:HD-GYP domain-containing protein (c-di-GMP phosphodiesterase class II)
MVSELQSPAEVAEDDRSEDRSRFELGELLTIARALASERNTRTLLNLILAKSRQVTGADAGSVYVVEDAEDTVALGLDPRLVEPARAKRLRFILSQNDSMRVDFTEALLPVDDRSIVGKAVIDGRPINIPDLYRLSEPGANPWGFRHNRSFDERTGYKARSMLTVPLQSARGEVIGVIQLINRKRRPARTLGAVADFDGEVVPFDARSEELALALAAQAGISLENAMLYEEIRDLFEGFVDASVTAIESRDPTTSGHSRRVATLSVELAKEVDGVTLGPLAAVSFSRDDLRQIEYAGVLHDFGKVGVRESVLVKAKKLYDPQKELIRLRFDYVRKSIEAEALQRRLALIGAGRSDPEGLAAVASDEQARLAELEGLWELLVQANEPTIDAQEARERMVALGRRTYTDARGQLRPYLQAAEIEALRIPRGSLTDEERLEIQSHVNHTISFLKTIPWGRTFRRIPRIAGAHHEALDGGGYPHGLRGDEIPIESRMLMIADIFDALTASDRPYKPAVPVPRALSIIESEVTRGRCDPDLFRVFVGAKVYEKVL